MGKAEGDSVEKQLREQKREVKNLRAHLTDLTTIVMKGLAALDQVGERKDVPNSVGADLAKIANAIEVANDRARYFGLGVDWRTDKKPRPRAPSPIHVSGGDGE